MIKIIFEQDMKIYEKNSYVCYFLGNTNGSINNFMNFLIYIEISRESFNII